LKEEKSLNKKLVLSDGSEFYGKAFGYKEDVYGEVVFTTSMSGYQELLTDPSLLGQMLVMTYPMVGNYGINRDDYESMKPYLSALIVKEHCDAPSNFRSEKTLEAYMDKYRLPGLFGVDTRQLTRHIREKGALKGAILPAEMPLKECLEKIENYPFFTNHVERASTKNAYEVPGGGKRVILMDFGLKMSILKSLLQAGYHVSVVPQDTSAEAILEQNPDGVLLSNGPGNPEDAEAPIETVKALLGKVPIFGICMGHQLLALAAGAGTRKMKFGHRGGNNAVRDLRTGKILITSQNHGYEVDKTSLEGTELSIIYECVNDDSIEGLELPTKKAFSVQFHPESSPGPRDAKVLFEEFDRLMENREVL